MTVSKVTQSDSKLYLEPVSQISATKMIGDLRTLPVSLLMILYEWIMAIVRMIRRLISDEVEKTNSEARIDARLASYQNAGQEAYNLHLESKAPLPDCSWQISQKTNIPAQTVLANAKRCQSSNRYYTKEKARSLKIAGFTTREIAKKLKISQSKASRLSR